MTQEAPGETIFWKKNQTQLLSHEDVLAVPEGQRVECSAILQSPWRRDPFVAREYVYHTGRVYHANAFSEHTMDTKVFFGFRRYYRAGAKISICSTQAKGTEDQAREATEYLDAHKSKMLEWTPQLMEHVVHLQKSQVFGWRLAEACAVLVPIYAVVSILKMCNFI